MSVKSTNKKLFVVLLIVVILAVFSINTIINSHNSMKTTPENSKTGSAEVKLTIIEPPTDNLNLETVGDSELNKDA